MNPAVEAVNLGAAAGDLSLWGLFVQADIVVKIVMLMLILASVWVWAIVFEKVTTLRRANRAPSPLAFSCTAATFWACCCPPVTQSPTSRNFE